MEKLKFAMILVAVSLVTACDKEQGAGGEKAGATAKTAATEGPGCAFESTKDGSPLVIKVAANDTPEAKTFLQTCINPYTKLYAADAEKAKEGKKKFGYYSCTQCHGPNGDGQVAVSINDERWQYSKHVTDKGMFETIAGGSNNGMFAWHQQIANNPDLLPTDDILKIIGWLRTQYKGGDDTPWLD